MYINPFVAGIIATLLVEVCFIIIHGVIQENELGTKVHEIELTDDEKDEIVKLLKSKVEKTDEQNNSN